MLIVTEVPVPDGKVSSPKKSSTIKPWACTAGGSIPEFASSAANAITRQSVIVRPNVRIERMVSFKMSLQVCKWKPLGFQVESACYGTTGTKLRN